MWIILISTLIGLCFASLLYFFNRKKHFGKTLTVILFILRTFTTVAICILFFNPYFKNKNTKIEPATIIIAQDNSNSLILNKDSSFYKTTYPLLFDAFTNELSKDFIVDKYLFGNKVREFDRIDFQDYYTDFHDLLKTVKKNYYKKNVGALVILSDGICNKSYLPEQNIEAYPFPIYTVTLGDTTNYPDIYIKDIFYNKTSPSNSIIPVRLIANAINCRDMTMTVKIIINNEIVETTETNINSNHFSKTFDFNLDSEDEGVKQIDVIIEYIDGEIVTNNNSKRFFIEVIDKKYKALVYAKSPHPDLGCLKNILGDHFETEMIFNDNELPDFKDFDIVFMHQIPFVGMSDYNILETHLKNNKNVPVFYIVGEHTDIEVFNNLQPHVEITKGAVQSMLDIKPNYNNTFGLFSINDKIVNAINMFPPLSLPHLDISFKTNHDIILQMNINDVIIQSPLLSFSSDGNRKNAYLFGTGVWRWKLYDYYNHKGYDNFEELFSKSIKYLLTEKDKELVVSYKENYFNNEDIIFTANLKDPSQELTTAPDLRIRITNKHSGKAYEYDFSKSKNNYHLNINTLPEGIYDFMAEAKYGNLTYSDNGRFSVVNVGAEAQELVANSQRMKLLSNLTGGKNYNCNELDSLAKTLENEEEITSIAIEETKYQDLINWKALFFIILSLISIEWILRKMFGIY